MSSMQILTAVTLVAGFTGGYAGSEMGVLQLSPEQWDGVIMFFGTMMAGFLIVRLASRLMDRQSKASSTPAEEKKEDRILTREEVAKHAKEDDLWIILKTKEHNKHRVYNVTEYVDSHPGGLSIMNQAGKDSTEGFYGPQHPPRVYDLIEDFYIGDLVDP